ncbi:hypothetical protein [Streptomyces sp. NPDC005336]|uniref:hypothetical protein n=1 Tax=Streptomyces sp. NPDC005336 TaxID=3157035 RepID=UPI0033A7F3AE
MSVFSRFRRASRETSRSSEEAPTEKAAAIALTAEPESGTADEPEAARGEEETPAGESAGIPKQQSAAEAADSEAGEGART